MGRWPHGHDSRTAWASATSAAYDRAATADRMQAALEAAGWTVTRNVFADSVTVVLLALEPDGFARDGGVYSGPTALDALRLATSWAIGEGSEGGEQ